MHGGIITAKNKEDFLREIKTRNRLRPAPIVVKCNLHNLKQDDFQWTSGDDLSIENVTFDESVSFLGFERPEGLVVFKDVAFNQGVGFYHCSLRTLGFDKVSASSIKFDRTRIKMPYFRKIEVDDLDIGGLEIVPEKDWGCFLNLTEVESKNLIIRGNKSKLSVAGVVTNDIVIAQQLMFAGIPAFVSTEAVREHFGGKPEYV